MYDWSQNPQTVTVSIPLSYKIDAKKVDSVITENYVKLNIPEMKIFKFIDLFNLIDPDSSSIVIEDRRIIFYLNKIKQEKWDNLEFKSSNKDEVKERRRVAEENYNKKILLDRQTAANKKNELGKFVFDKSIKIDEEKRKELKEKKNYEKTEAEKELYNFINNIEHKKDVTNNQPVSEGKKINNTNEINDLNISNNQSISEFKKEKISQYGNQTPQVAKKENAIFDDNNLETTSTTQAPNVRQQTNIKVNLTEKLIPHFAARESLAKEPPYPKSKKYVPEKNMLGQEIEDRNPIWIKEKADNFYKNKDYRSAINAYNRAIELDPDFHKCYLNRATCLLLLGEFELALSDLSKLQDLLDRIDSTEKEDTFYFKIKIKCLIKSYAIYSILNNYTKANEIIDEILNNKEIIFILGDRIIEKIKKDKIIIEQRKITEELKTQADKLVSMKEFHSAKEIYLKILEENPHPNEKIYSNLSLIAMNEKDYQTCIDYCTTVLKIIKSFKEKINIKTRKFDNSLEIKILLRRAESYVEIGEMTKAQEDLETAERFEITNKDIINKFNNFKERLKTIVLQNYEKSANDLLKQKKFAEALEFYEKSITLIKKKDKLDQIKFYINRSSCLLALGQFENVINECTRILGMILKHKNVATINSNFDVLKQLLDLEFMIYVKRAFAYTKSNKIEEAIKDYNSALVINPNDSNLKKNLTALKNINS